MRSILGDGGHYELETIERFGGTRSPLDTPLWRAISDWVEATEPGAKAGAALLLPASPTRTGSARRSAPSPTASSRCGRWSAELAARLIHSADERTHVDDLGLGVEFLRAAARSLALAVLELHSPEGAFEQIEAYLRERGFFAPGGEELEADLYLGYGLSEPLRRTAAPAPPEPCPLPLAAVAVRDTSEGSVPGTRLGSDSGSGRGPMRTTPKRSRRCAPRSGAATSTRSTSSSTSRAPFAGER